MRTRTAPLFNFFHSVKYDKSDNFLTAHIKLNEYLQTVTKVLRLLIRSHGIAHPWRDNKKGACHWANFWRDA